MSQNVLLVEGINDTNFYDAFCREIGLKNIKVTGPRSLGTAVDGKTNAIHILPKLLDQLNDATIGKMGLIVDADYEIEHGLGFNGTLTKIREQVTEKGFFPEKRFGHGGFIFEHNDGLPSFGVWIMPDNSHDGMLENFIKDSIQLKEQCDLHARASKVVGELASPLFKPIHRAKADVSTWLSWQKMPGVRLESTVGSHLIDLKSPRCSALKEWIQKVFS